MIADGPRSHIAHARSADSSIEYAENRTAPVASFVAYDQDGDAIRWSLSGPDAGRFTMSGDGVLRFTEPPDYEEGTVSIDRPQPQVSRPLGANLSDEDEAVSVQGWQWARSQDGATWTDIEGATSPRRSPEPDDEAMYLRATVIYSDKFGSGKTASAVSAHRVEAKTLSNAAPSFAEQDDDEATSYVDIARSVAENTTVGKRQLRTRAPLNYEARNTYTVVVTATDPVGASDSIVVTINVTDEDDPAEITMNAGEADGGTRKDG